MTESNMLFQRRPDWDEQRQREFDEQRIESLKLRSIWESYENRKARELDELVANSGYKSRECGSGIQPHRNDGITIISTDGRGNISKQFIEYELPDWYNVSGGRL